MMRNTNALDGLPRSMEEWSKKNDPVAGINKAWLEIGEMAASGNKVAIAIAGIGSAMAAKKKADAQGTEVPAWARETLQFMDCYQSDDAEGVEDALSALSAALR
jgi:hypothetical protein